MSERTERMEEFMLLEASQQARVAAAGAAIAATLPTCEVALGDFLQVWTSCDAAWNLVKGLPLEKFMDAFGPPPDDLSIPQEPQAMDGEPAGLFLPKIVSYHLERETVLALAKCRVYDIPTGDFFACLSRLGILKTIEKFPALTFFYALDFGTLPKTREGQPPHPSDAAAPRTTISNRTETP